MTIEAQLSDVLVAMNSLTAALGRLATVAMALVERTEQVQPFMKPLDLSTIPAPDERPAIAGPVPTVRPVWLDCPRGAVTEGVCCKNIAGCRAVLAAESDVPKVAKPTPAAPKSKHARPSRPHRPIEQMLITPERRTYLEVYYPAGVSIHTILAAINAMPGRKFKDANELSMRVSGSSMALRRPAGFRQEGAPTTLEEAHRMRDIRATEPAPPPISSKPVIAPPAPPMVFPRAEPGTALPPVSRPWHEIKAMAFAAGYSLASYNDLPAYNRARIARGDAPFAIGRP